MPLLAGTIDLDILIDIYIQLDVYDTSTPELVLPEILVHLYNTLPTVEHNNIQGGKKAVCIPIHDLSV